MKEKICKWIQRIAEQEKLSSDIIALNFGLFESENGYTIYLIGSKEYDTEDDDWACNEDFAPKEKYIEFPFAPNDKMSWEVFLNNVVQIITDCINSKDTNIVQLCCNRVITVGFDDGNLQRIR